MRGVLEATCAVPLVGSDFRLPAQASEPQRRGGGKQLKGDGDGEPQLRLEGSPARGRGPGSGAGEEGNGAGGSGGTDVEVSRKTSLRRVSLVAALRCAARLLLRRCSGVDRA